MAVFATAVHRAFPDLLGQRADAGAAQEQPAGTLAT
jgi:biotin transport system substrate-specific component